MHILSDIVPAIAHTAVSILTGFPIDTVKTNMQNYNFKSYTQCVKHIYNSGSILAFYRGVLVPLTSNMAFRPLEFYTFETIQKKYNPWLGGSAAGVVAGLVSYPFHVVKINRQLNQSFIKIVKKMSCKSLYRGFKINMAKDFVFCTLFFGSYQTMKNQDMNAGIAGMIASNLVWLVLCPFDVVRTRILSHSQPRSILDTAKHIIQTQGVRGLWRGVIPVLLKTTPVTGLSMLTYDTIKTQLNQKKKEERL